MTEVDLNAAPLVAGEARVLESLRSSVRRVRRPRRDEAAAHEQTPPTPGGSATTGEAASAVGWRFHRPLLRVVDRVVTAIAFWRAVRSCEADVVFVHWAHDYYPWLAGLFGCRPLVVTVLGGDVLFEEQGSPSTREKWLTIRLLREADYITTQSNFLTEAVNQLGDFQAKTERVLWGVSLDDFRRRDASALQRELGLRPEARVVLSPKILQPFYRVHLVVEAMAIVCRRVPDAVLVVSEYAADPDYREQLARLAAELDLAEHVKFAGDVPDEAMPDFYSLAELSIGIPPSDGLPQALLESLASETPQILTRLPRYEEIVRHEESAYFVDPDPDSIAAGILRLLEDDELRTRIAQRGRRIVEEQANIDEQAAHVEARFRELAATTRPRTLRWSALISAVPAYMTFRRTA